MRHESAGRHGSGDGYGKQVSGARKCVPEKFQSKLLKKEGLIIGFSGLEYYNYFFHRLKLNILKTKNDL